jgi:D-alanyl-lipoteichoic acid acyltransferase DltB (MBOAT superfamily)
MAFIPIYILILGFTILIDYFAGIWLEEAEKHKRAYLMASLVANIGVLATFKYYNFLNDNLSQALNAFGYKNIIPNLGILLPIGLSFHTFQAMSYTIEVYRGHQKAERTFGIYALYVMFYPQLVAGPIERPQNLIHQFYEEHYFDYDRVVDGLKLILWGLFKKVVIADRLALYVNAAYNNPQQHTGITLALATVFFAFQIYCDFSGYSDMAIGVAQVMGFRLMTNFNRPYFARSISEFWKRWHISLSTWFKDYLYIPLGGSRVSTARCYCNLLFVFVVSGLWHGANWTFIIWGALNGLYLACERITARWHNDFNPLFRLDRLPRLRNAIQIVLTFLLVCVAWVFFRANSAGHALLILEKISTLKGPLFIRPPSELIYSAFGVAFLMAVEIKQEYYKGTFSFMGHPNPLIRHCSYTLLIIVMLLIGVFDGGQFIYFQF